MRCWTTAIPPSRGGTSGLRPTSVTMRWTGTWKSVLIRRRWYICNFDVGQRDRAGSVSVTDHGAYLHVSLRRETFHDLSPVVARCAGDQDHLSALLWLVWVRKLRHFPLLSALALGFSLVFEVLQPLSEGVVQRPLQLLEAGPAPARRPTTPRCGPVPVPRSRSASSSKGVPS
jgi:hypothetical protein